MIDEKSGSRFWDVNAITDGGETDSFIVQSCKTKDAEYIERVLLSVHPEFIEMKVEAIPRPKELGRCYGDPY